jgi:hypothetical protein
MNHNKPTIAVKNCRVKIVSKNTSDGPSRADTRTWDKLAEFIFNFAEKKQARKA